MHTTSLTQRGLHQCLATLLLSSGLAASCAWAQAGAHAEAHQTAQEIERLQEVERLRGITMAQELTEKDIQNIFNQGNPIPDFTGKRTFAQIKEACTEWAEPKAPDAISHSWYRAATTLNATKRKNAAQYQQMMVLYEAAARRGHYRAMMHLTMLYSQGQKTWDDMVYRPEPDKARMWINEGLRREWVGALEWLATAYHDGSAGYPRNERKSLAYLQLAADRGSSMAQYQIGLQYDNVIKSRNRAEGMYLCAALQGNYSPANQEWAISRKIDQDPQQALLSYQIAVMNGGKNGGESAFSLFSAFVPKEPDNDQKALGVFYDPIRAQAYKDLWAVLLGNTDSQGVQHNGNVFLRFPRLPEALPIPPAKVTEWKGIYSAMSPEDAEYYQNPPPAEYYIEQIRNAGYLPPKGYLQEPVPYKEK